MQKLRATLALLLAELMLLPFGAVASNHREAPITALDHKADITDLYAFVSYSANQAPNTAPSKVTLILCVDPLLEPANGPTYFPFDPNVVYEIKIDNNNDAEADMSFEFRFQTQQTQPGLFTAMAGAGDGVAAPANSPAPVPAGTPIVPPRITSLTSAGLGQRQPYIVSLVRNDIVNRLGAELSQTMYAVPANIGPRTMDYSALYKEGTYSLPGGVKVFAGTVDDPFWIDLGGAFDTINLRKLGSGVPGVLTDMEDSAKENFASDTVSGYAVNAIAIEVPIEMLTRTGRVEPADSRAATIGVWATTSRPSMTVRRSPDVMMNSGPLRQVQRIGNPLINELLIGIGSKDKFSMDVPKNDAQFANFLLDPLLPRVVNALTNGVVAIPAAPRTDLLPLVTYAPPIAAAGTPAGPVADLLRLNTGVPATPPAMANRMGLLGGDAAGFPNGRRLMDDVVDIALRVAVGGVLAGPNFNKFPNNRLGDGVNVNDAPYKMEFPYVAECPSGRDRRHIDPGEPGGGPIQ
ncbi:MAG: DUF4331 domain-containing protein [Bryobacteraceae bacterium]|nr:DUF4331 domain-containing protein [Bryobacteraceae bacterium]